MRDKDILDFFDYLHEPIDLLLSELLIAGQSLVERIVKPVIFLDKIVITS